MKFILIIATILICGCASINSKAYDNDLSWPKRYYVLKHDIPITYTPSQRTLEDRIDGADYRMLPSYQQNKYQLED
jgi:hypothetical protein